MEVKIIKKKNKEGLQEKKRTEKNRQEFEKEFSKVSPDIKMYLKHGEAFPGFDQSRRIRGGLKQGGRAKFPDLTGDGKVTRADVLKGRGVFAAGGKVPENIKKRFKKNPNIKEKILPKKKKNRLEELRKELG